MSRKQEWKLYRRKILFQSDKKQIVQCLWPPDSASEFHDHGQATGLVVVMSGIISNAVYYKDGRLRTIEAFGPGKTFWETPVMIHRMMNIGDKVVVTIHIYDRRLRMRTYKEKDLISPT